MKKPNVFFKSSIAFLLMLTVMVSSLWASKIEVHHYMERTGDRVAPILWKLEWGGQLRLVYKSDGETSVVITNPDLSTVSWQLDRQEKQTQITARRDGNTIHLRGVVKGEAVTKAMPIDAAPWFQSTTLSLRGFIQQPTQRCEFWILRPDEFSAYKLQAIKEKTLKTVIEGQPVAVVQVQLSPTGILSAFWKSRYWFRAKDGVFLRFEGPSGPPGSPKTEVSLIASPPG
jgi:hypothetical protein